MDMKGIKRSPLQVSAGQPVGVGSASGNAPGQSILFYGHHGEPIYTTTPEDRSGASFAGNNHFNPQLPHNAEGWERDRNTARGSSSGNLPAGHQMTNYLQYGLPPSSQAYQHTQPPYDCDGQVLMQDLQPPAYHSIENNRYAYRVGTAEHASPSHALPIAQRVKVEQYNQNGSETAVEAAPTQYQGRAEGRKRTYERVPDGERKRKASRQIAPPAPIGHTFEELSQADQLLVTEAAKGHRWNDIRPEWERLAGHSVANSTLANRHVRILNKIQPFSESDNISLMEAKEAIESVFEKEKWKLVADSFALKRGRRSTWSPTRLKEHWKMLMSNSAMPPAAEDASRGGPPVLQMNPVETHPQDLGQAHDDSLHATDYHFGPSQHQDFPDNNMVAAHALSLTMPLRTTKEPTTAVSSAVGQVSRLARAGGDASANNRHELGGHPSRADDQRARGQSQRVSSNPREQSLRTIIIPDSPATSRPSKRSDAKVADRKPGGKRVAVGEDNGGGGGGGGGGGSSSNSTKQDAFSPLFVPLHSPVPRRQDQR